MTIKKAIERFQGWLDEGYHKINKQTTDWREDKEALELAIQCMKDKRLQGEWIPKRLWDNTHIWVCSECGNQNKHGITVEKACWKCGAKMKGGAE